MPEISMKIVHPVTGEDIEVDLSFEITGSEPDVGIIGYQVEELQIVGEHKDLNDKMTDAMWSRIEEAIYNEYDEDDFVYEGD